MKPPPLFPIIEEWSPAQKLAVYDFCRLLSETLWLQYEDLLIEEMMRIDRANGFTDSCEVEERNLELPFDDDDLTF